MKVKNFSGIRVNNCSCGSWLEHWKKFSGQPLSIFCAVLDCVQKPEVGARVQKEGTDDPGWYIVPLCKSHNDRFWSSYYITEAVTLVSTNVDKTCGTVKSRAAGSIENVRSEMEANQEVKGKMP